MPLEISNIQASTTKSTACRRHSQRHGCQTSAFWSGNPECHTVLCPGNCHTVPEPAIVTPFWSQQSSHRSGASNRHTVPEPAIVTTFRSQQTITSFWSQQTVTTFRSQEAVSNQQAVSKQRAVSNQTLIAANAMRPNKPTLHRQRHTNKPSQRPLIDATPISCPQKKPLNCRQGHPHQINWHPPN